MTSGSIVKNATPLLSCFKARSNVGFSLVSYCLLRPFTFFTCVAVHDISFLPISLGDNRLESCRENRICGYAALWQGWRYHCFAGGKIPPHIPSDTVNVTKFSRTLKDTKKCKRPLFYRAFCTLKNFTGLRFGGGGGNRTPVRKHSAVTSWWRRGESNPRPKAFSRDIYIHVS